MNFQVIAESIVHSDRRLLIGREGRGYIQLDASSMPIAVSERDFARLRAMQHYRPTPTIRMPLAEGQYRQVAD